MEIMSGFILLGSLISLIYAFLLLYFIVIIRQELKLIRKAVLEYTEARTK
jgi:hypothetical protein